MEKGVFYMADALSRILMDVVILFLFILFVIIAIKTRFWQRLLKRIFEKIGSGYFKKGTRDSIFQSERTVYGKSESQMRDAVNDFYDEMVGNIDNYLDRFYSFSGLFEQAGRTLSSFFSGNDVTEAKKKQTLEMLKDTITPSFDLAVRLNEICSSSNDEFKTEIEKILKINSVGRKGKNYELKIQSAISSYREIGMPDSEINPLLTIGVGAAGTILSSAFAEEVLSTALDSFLPTTISDALSGPLGLGFGILLGLGINYTGVKLDELINRKKYRQGLVKYIEKERSLYLEELEKTFSLHQKRAEEICFDKSLSR